ncbi:S1/P1 nuclease [Nannocystaceae bacterium ST9]
MPARRRTRRSRFACWSLLAALSWTCLTPGTASAWHDDGHRIVGEIADRRLSPEVRVRVRELLAGMPDYDTMATAATWPDQKAKLDETFAFAYSSHYVNVGEPISPRELYKTCLAQSGCVATGILYYADVLRSDRTSDEQKGEALRFLIHFVGDVHQPLHAGRVEDKGGNEVKNLQFLEYTPDKQRANLHALWDGGIIALALGRGGKTWASWAAELDQQITPEQRDRWVAVDSVIDWVEESRRFAAAYAYLDAEGVGELKKGDVLGEAWYERNRPIVEQRLQQAGVRLAVLIEDALGRP